MISKADTLVNNEIKVTSPRSQWFGHIGRVKKVMADGRTLEVLLDGPANNSTVFIDITLVKDTAWLNSKTAPLPQSLGPDANSLLPVNRI